jgi:NitT/TauT family transport system substrate-binding protein
MDFQPFTVRAEYRNMQKHTPVIIVIICVIAAGVLLGLWYSAPEPSAYAGTPDRVSIGAMADESASLLYVADELGYFTKNGLELAIRNYPNGAVAIRGMENGEVNLTLSSEFPLVAETLNGEDILIIGSIDRYYGTFLIARRDHGIETIPDLKGKRIAVSKNSVGEFYLGRFLDLNGMDMQDIALVDSLPAQSLIDLAEGSSVDAVVTTRIRADPLVQRSEHTYILFPVESNQATYKILAGRSAWVTDNPRAVSRLMQSLTDAGQFTASQPDDARTLVQNRLNLTDDYVQTVWPEHQFALTLDQSLILAMEDEARWMIRNNLSENQQVPNFLDVMYPDGMNAVRPGSARIIRGP